MFWLIARLGISGATCVGQATPIEATVGPAGFGGGGAGGAGLGGGGAGGGGGLISTGFGGGA